MGARGASLAPLHDSLAQALPHLAIAAPDAPFAHGADLHEWYSLAGVTARNRLARITAARDARDAVLAQTIAGHGLTGRLDRVALVGFSQGATMVFDALACGRWPVAAAVTFACRATPPTEIAPPGGTRILMVHGTEDAAVPLASSLSGWKALRRCGHDAGFLACAATGHEIAPEAATYAAALIRRAIPAR